MTNIALRAARQGAQVIVRALDRPDLVRLLDTGPGGLLATNLHVQAEKAMVEALRKAYPGCTIESRVLDRRDLSTPPGASARPRTPSWRLETLGGALNLKREVPCFAIALSARLQDRVEHAVIVDPVTHEEFSASRGHGARLNNRRLRVDDDGDANLAIAGVSPPAATAQRPAFQQRLERLLEAGFTPRLSGCAALDLAYLAAGRYRLFAGAGLCMAELEAACLLVQEAGGLVADLAGGVDYQRTGDLLAAGPRTLKQLLRAGA